MSRSPSPKPGNIRFVTMVGYDAPWRCRVASKRASSVGSFRVEWLDGPLAGRSANVAKEYLQK